MYVVQPPWGKERHMLVRLTCEWSTTRIILMIPVRKPNVRFEHNKCKTEVRFLRASHIANSNPSLLNRIVHDSYDLHVKRLFVLRCTLSNFNGNFNATISQGVTTGKINRARTKHIYVRPVVIEALGKNFSLSLLLIRYTRRWIGGIIIGIVYL